jgi:hypothetical protein
MLIIYCILAACHTSSDASSGGMGGMANANMGGSFVADGTAGAGAGGGSAKAGANGTGGMAGAIGQSGGTGGGNEGPLAIFPSPIEVRVGSTLQLNLKSRVNGAQEDVTNKAVWSVNDTSIGAMEATPPAGVLRAISRGKVQVSATYAGKAISVEATLFEDEVELRPAKIAVVPGFKFLVEALLIRQPQGTVLENLNAQTVWSIPSNAQTRVSPDTSEPGRGIFNATFGPSLETELTAKIAGKEFRVPVTVAPHPRFSDFKVFPISRSIKVGSANDKFTAYGFTAVDKFEEVTGETRWLPTGLALRQQAAVFNGKSIACTKVVINGLAAANMLAFYEGFSALVSAYCTDKTFASIKLMAGPLSIKADTRVPVSIAAYTADGSIYFEQVNADTTVVSSAPEIVEVVSVPQCCTLVAKSPGLARIKSTYENLSDETTFSVQP